MKKSAALINEAPDLRTRDRVIALLSQGAATAGELGDLLGLKPAAIRRHLDVMLAEGLVSERERVQRGPRGRGRPAKVFVLTDAAREGYGKHTYDDLASSALRWIASQGDGAVTAFAAAQVAALEERCEAAVRAAGDDPLARAEALAAALTAEGYAASASTIASGGQLCQHHCPVAHVAAEFPQLCEAETRVISRLVGTHVQRLATIAHGDGVCTTHIPGQVTATTRAGDHHRPERARMSATNTATEVTRAGDHHRPERARMSATNTATEITRAGDHHRPERARMSATHTATEKSESND